MTLFIVYILLYQFGWSTGWYITAAAVWAGHLIYYACINN